MPQQAYKNYYIGKCRHSTDSMVSPKMLKTKDFA